ncbi:MAG: hypothetical protein IJA10_02925 [Lachnospiraceae bacterium]|nr:hypothetical protein [Lachnospiraceae bacterium]
MNSYFQCSHVGFQNIAVNGNDGWVCNMFCSALFHVDLTTLEMTLETILPAENECGFKQYGPISYYKEKLIIAPLNGKDILIYDLKKKTIDCLQLDTGKIVAEEYVFLKIVLYNEVAFFVPLVGHCIVKLDLNTNEMEYLDDWFGEVERESGLEERNAIFSDVYDNGDGNIWLTSWQGNLVMEFNMNTNQYKLHSISGLEALSSVVVTENNMMLTERDFSTLSLYSFDGICSKMQIDYPGFVSRWGIGKLHLYGEYVFLFPLFANMILKYNRITGEVQCAKELNVQGKENSNVISLKRYVMKCCERINEEEVIYYSIPDSKIVKFNMKTCVAEELYTSIKEEEQEYLKSRLLEKSFLEGNYEKESLRLDSFIECIQGKYRGCSDDIGEDSSSYGKKIYQYLND